jgi:hypothetical protein
MLGDGVLMEFFRQASEAVVDRVQQNELRAVLRRQVGCVIDRAVCICGTVKRHENDLGHNASSGRGAHAPDRIGVLIGM